MSDEDGDPFERLDESVGDREGDPFEEFSDVETPDDETGDHDEVDDVDRLTEATGEPGGGGPTDGTEYDGHDVTPADHEDELPAEETAAAGDHSNVVEKSEPSIETGVGDEDDPFGDVGQRAGDPFEDDIFEEMDVAELDPDDVWESIADAEERGSVSERAERTYAEVSKHSFCEQCEFFSDPPDVSCSHDGTEILEFLDQETVRLVDCPVVEERKELEKHE